MAYVTKQYTAAPLLFLVAMATIPVDNITRNIIMPDAAPVPPSAEIASTNTAVHDCKNIGKDKTMLMIPTTNFIVFMSGILKIVRVCNTETIITDIGRSLFGPIMGRQ